PDSTLGTDANWDTSFFAPGPTNVNTFAFPVLDSSADVSVMVPFRDRLIVAGHFDHVAGEPAERLASWDGSSWSAMSTPFALCSVDGAAVGNAGLTLAGGFLWGGAHDSLAVVAAWDGAGWSALDSWVPAGGFSRANAILADSDGVTIAGWFPPLAGTG